MRLSEKDKEYLERLRELVTDPDLRAKLGSEGRAYVEKYHSLDAVGELLDGIYRGLWPRRGKADRGRAG